MVLCKRSGCGSQDTQNIWPVTSTEFKPYLVPPKTHVVGSALKGTFGQKSWLLGVVFLLLLLLLFIFILLEG